MGMQVGAKLARIITHSNELLKAACPLLRWYIGIFEYCGFELLVQRQVRRITEHERATLPAILRSTRQEAISSGCEHIVVVL